METKNKSMRIVWAVDPLGEEIAFQAAAARFLRVFADRASLEVHPIYLHGSYPLEYSPYAPVELDETTRTQMKSALAAICERSPIRGIRELEIIAKGFPNLKEGVRLLVDRASELDADAILVTTHARKGVSRWIIGSFAETLMEKSTIPLLILNPESNVEWSPAAVVFATDLSAESRCAFRRFLPLAAVLRSEVTIYHQGVHALSEGLAPAFSAAPVVMKSEKADKEKKWSESTARNWRRVAATAGVKSEIFVDEALSRSPADGALEKAQELKAWIAIAAQSRPTPIGMIGSNARRVLRDARVPVWLYRAPHGSAYCEPLDFGEDDIECDLRLPGARSDDE